MACLGLPARHSARFYSQGKSVSNGFIESFNGCLRDECLNVAVFFTLEDVRERLWCWQEIYTLTRPHSALQDQAPVTFVQRTGRRLYRTPTHSHE